VSSPFSCPARKTSRALYRGGIVTGNATFEKSAQEWEKWDREHPRACRLVARAGREALRVTAGTPLGRVRPWMSSLAPVLLLHELHPAVLASALRCVVGVDRFGRAETGGGEPGGVHLELRDQDGLNGFGAAPG